MDHEGIFSPWRSYGSNFSGRIVVLLALNQNKIDHKHCVLRLTYLFLLNIISQLTCDCLYIVSYCCALLYRVTPIITITVPSPLSNVTGLPNKITESHIRKARFTVFATLK